MARPRFFPFYRLFPFPFSHFESNFRRLFDGTSFFSAPKLTFSLLRPVLPHASGTSSRDLTLYFLRTPLCAQREYFSDSDFPSFFTPCSTFLFPLISFPPLIHPALHLLPPLFSHSSPLFHLPPQLTMQMRALAHYARTRTIAHTPAHQEVFVYCLHRFTHPSQSTGHQCIRCEGKQEKAFTIYTTTSQSRH